MANNKRKDFTSYSEWEAEVHRHQPDAYLHIMEDSVTAFFRGLYYADWNGNRGYVEID